MSRWWRLEDDDDGAGGHVEASRATAISVLIRTWGYMSIQLDAGSGDAFDAMLSTSFFVSAMRDDLCVAHYLACVHVDLISFS